jgi:hypothetical protein
MLILNGVIGCRGEGDASKSGAWTGSIDENAVKPIGIRFVLEDEHGKLIGQTFIQDQGTEEYVIEAALTGTRDGATATWTTETDVVIKGHFGDNDFLGTIEFPADHEAPSVLASLRLSR